MLPPSEIRRLGNRRRITRRVTTGIAAAALLAVAGFGVYSSPLLDEVLNGPDWANTTSPSPQPTPRELGWETVPGVEAFFPPEGLGLGTVLAEQTELGTGKGTCDPGALGSPNAVRVREVAGVGFEKPFGWATVLQYDTAAEATVSFEMIRDAALGCSGQAADSGLTDPSFRDYSAQVAFDASTVEAEPVTMAYISGGGLLPGSDEAIFSDTVVLQAGDRVLWLTESVQGMDFNCGPAPVNDAVQCVLPAVLGQAAQNLLK